MIALIFSLSFILAASFADFLVCGISDQHPVEHPFVFPGALDHKGIVSFPLKLFRQRGGIVSLLNTPS